MTLPQAVITPVPLNGEPATDKAFACDGITYRVRTLQAVTGALVVTASVGATPFRRELDITVTQIGEDGDLVRGPDGKAVIVAQTRWVVDDMMVTSDDPLSAADTHMMLIRNLIWRAIQAAPARAAMDALIADWGGGVTTVPLEVPADPRGDPIAALDPEYRPDLTPAA